jgi:hypothetical protein
MKLRRSTNPGCRAAHSDGNVFLDLKEVAEGGWGSGLAGDVAQGLVVAAEHWL